MTTSAKNKGTGGLGGRTADGYEKNARIKRATARKRARGGATIPARQAEARRLSELVLEKDAVRKAMENRRRVGVAQKAGVKQGALPMRPGTDLMMLEASKRRR